MISISSSHEWCNATGGSAKSGELAAAESADASGLNGPAGHEAPEVVRKGLGRNQDAIADLRTALTLDPQDATRQEVDGLLRQLAETP